MTLRPQQSLLDNMSPDGYNKQIWDWENPTLPGGYVIYGFLDRETKEIFEIILKDQVVQSYHFLKP